MDKLAGIKEIGKDLCYVWSLQCDKIHTWKKQQLQIVKEYGKFFNSRFESGMGENLHGQEASHT